ncbi:uncharacterized protein LOC128962104 [Oppia nitens]|uniref:uncharacterized protein LOC128962104 n=1 Tax=Oppia nitens TaxID=1686743 RepID=UPI0023DA13EC|nr:uncharacterized protein LOC128962104 [Oppia nitens]
MLDNSVAIAWSNLTVSSSSSSSRLWTGLTGLPANRVILRELCGQISFGQLTGLMGASGSGKTTLLNCLMNIGTNDSYRISDQSLVYCTRDRPIVRRFVCLNHMIGGQQQQLLLNDELTVGEALMYSSKVNNSLLLTTTGCVVNHKKLVHKLMTELLINDIDDQRIGDCSGGQRKRIAIGLQLTSVVMPNLVCMDEPTTGLDSTAALELIKCLKQLANRHNIALVVSIHQPNQELLKLFDSCYVLAKSGQCIYDDSPRQLRNWLTTTTTTTSTGIKLRKTDVPIEVLMKLSSQESGDSSDGQRLSDRLRQTNRKQLAIRKCLTTNLIQENQFIGYNSQLKPFSFDDLWVITGRSLKCTFGSNRYTDHRWLLELTMFTVFQLFVRLFITDQSLMSTGCFDPDLYTGTCMQWVDDSFLLGMSVNHLVLNYYFAYSMHSVIIVNRFADNIHLLLDEYRNYFNRSLWLMYVILITMLINQLLATLVGTLVGQKSKLLAYMSVTSLMFLMKPYANFFIRLSHMKPMLQLVSQLTYFKLVFNLLLIILYGGSGRCGRQTSNKTTSTIKSLILNDYDLMDDDNQFRQLLVQTHIYWLTVLMIVCKSLKILDNITGSFTKQSLNAIMGPSGSGKTTLLRCLNNSGHQINGQSIADNVVYYSRNISQTCFISQNIGDHLLSGLTIKQTLLYASKLKNSGQQQQPIDHQSIVANLIGQLLIGNDIADGQTSVDQCSGGELKRLVIASELTGHRKPELMFIDEPTSGLDSCSALAVIQCLKRLTQSYSNMTIVVTIHQPNQELMQLFDSVYVLASSGGRPIYQGCPRQLKQSVSETTNRHIRASDVPIEWLLKVATASGGDSVGNQLVDKLVAKQRRDNRLLGDQMIGDQSMIPTIHGQKFLANKKQWFSATDFQTLLSRQLQSNYYCWPNCLINILSATFILPLALIIIYHYNMDIVLNKTDCCYDRQLLDQLVGRLCIVADTNTRHRQRTELSLKQAITLNVLWLIIINMSTALLTVLKYYREIKLTITEHQNGWYSPGIYYWVSTIVELIPLSLSLAIYVYLVDYHQSWQSFIIYYTVYMLNILCTQCLAKLVSCLLYNNTTINNSTNTMIASLIILFQLILIVTLFFNSRPQDLHWLPQSIARISYMKYTFDCLLIQLYGWTRCLPLPGTVPMVLKLYKIDESSYWPNMGHTLGLVVGLQLLTMTMVIYKIKSSS